ncbi:MAG: helix-turn-helix domain-containing protein, partial [Acholeplasmatales bacterium]|nr:helix-turn-helix domain-containing protein [Acholeplasmatales bacterium]
IELNITNNINKYMTEKNKKRADLALYLNTTTQSVYRFFKGESTPSIKQLVMICNFLDITIYQLIGIEDKAKLSDEEFEIIKAIRDDELNKELVKRALNLK